MYFKKLELVGFKSFADKTVLHFEPGITAVVGPNGTGKCLHYDSLVTLHNGAKIKVGDLVEQALKCASSPEVLDDGFVVKDNSAGINILSLNLQTLKIEPHPVYAFIKRKAPEYLLKIKTRSGKTVTTTHYHPFFSIKDGQITELRAEQIKAGVRIAVPRALRTVSNNSKIDILSILRKFKEEDLLYIPYSQELSGFLTDLKSDYDTYNQMAGGLKTKQLAITSALGGQAMNVFHFVNLLTESGISEAPSFIRSLKSRSCNEISLPREMTSEIARFLGYIISEGRSTCENQIWFVNEDKSVIDDFIYCAKAGFAAEAKVFQYKESARDVIIFSAALCKFLEKAFGFGIEGLSKDKIIPEQVFNSEEKIVREFLSALFEGDAYICSGRPDNRNYFEYSTASSLLAYGVSSLLLRLGVYSSVKRKIKYAANTKERVKRDYYSVYVYGLENVRRLAGLLRFVGKKSEKLEAIKGLRYKPNPNLDLIPGVNAILKDLVKLSGIKVKRLRQIFPKLAAYYENRCLPTRKGLLEVLAVIAEHGNIAGLSEKIYHYLKILADSDLYWDEVASIVKVYSEEWVYDLSVLGTHNFIAEDIVVHNSNIFDGIRWVLGEQSAKSLRGSEMQDVIFNGTDLKEPIGMAEVSLTFSNEQRFFAVDNDEVVVTRRLFRSGESEYLLNKTLVRLKDVMDLFLGTGIGAESYSLVEQGKIDLILSSRPEDRRLVFDEASGITKYKSQKREALRKLEETEENLLRVNDIILEVKRQIGSLERQANKARRYKEAFEELKSKELGLAVLNKKQLHRQKEEIIRQLNQLQLEETRLLDLIQEEEAKITNRQTELKTQEASMMAIKNQILNLDNQIVRDSQHISFNKEKIRDLKGAKGYLETQLEQAENKVIIDEQSLNKARQDFHDIHKEIETKSVLAKEKQAELNLLASAIKTALENIAVAKKHILDLAVETAKVNSEIADLISKQQVHLARKKRLELEKAKVHEECAATQESLNSVSLQLETIKKSDEELNFKIANLSQELNREGASLDSLNLNLQGLEKQKLTLESHKEFIEKLKTKYEDISESMHVVVQLDKIPRERLTGLVVKIKNTQEGGLKLAGEAKPIEMDTLKIAQDLARIQEKLEDLKNAKSQKETRIAELNNSIQKLQQELRSLDIDLANKQALYNNTLEQFNKIKEEEDIIAIELLDAQKELEALGEKLAGLRSSLSGLQQGHKKAEELMSNAQNSISLNNGLKEKTIVMLTQLETEREALHKRINSDQATLKILEDTYKQDQENLENIQRQLKDNAVKAEALEVEIKDFQKRISETGALIKEHNIILKETEAKYQIIFDGSGDVLKKIDLERKELDRLKNKLYELQIQNKDIDFKYQSIKERLQEVYKIDLEGIEELPSEEMQEDLLSQDLQRLKDKLASYGNVNLVAIEEYDELKQRYDFLIQQQNDLNTAKDSLREALLKINRTTKQMFLETFQKVREEFRKYFRLLFNGGDAQVFLVDEQDPLESGIEIICRPPGKKLQNVLLLSGGEKALSAIALIFAIFKIKPSPFCVLDEIDAALDEANVDRFGRLLQEFTQTSQFIVITHNKRTIANAGVMYGITMQESGVSKIVSVKFAQSKNKDREPDLAVAESV